MSALLLRLAKQAVLDGPRIDYDAGTVRVPVYPPAPVNGILLTLTTEARVHLLRAPRRQCPACGHRRVLYRVEVACSPPHVSTTGGQCASCWGIREEAER